MNQVRRELIKKLDAVRDLRLSSKIQDYSRMLNRDAPCNPEELQPEFSLKIHISGSLPQKDELKRYKRIIVEMGHSKADKILERVKKINNELCQEQEILLSTPLITRMQDVETLRSSLELLIRSGFDKWECADLAGYRMLKNLKICPTSADWPLYTLNQEASAQLREMGFDSHVTSPDIQLADIYPANQECCAREFRDYQKTPLYISSTAPLTDDNIQSVTRNVTSTGESMTVNRRGQEWITTSTTAMHREKEIGEALKQGINRFRVDYSWGRKKEFGV